MEVGGPQRDAVARVVADVDRLVDRIDRLHRMPFVRAANRFVDNNDALVSLRQTNLNGDSSFSLSFLLYFFLCIFFFWLSVPLRFAFFLWFSLVGFFFFTRRAATLGLWKKKETEHNSNDGSKKKKPNKNQNKSETNRNGAGRLTAALSLSACAAASRRRCRRDLRRRRRLELRPTNVGDRWRILATIGDLWSCAIFCRCF